MDDIFYMEKALSLAKMAVKMGETPIGAIVVRKSDGKIVGQGFNMREQNRSSIHHAEILAIEDACKTLGGWRLTGCVLYVTLEPCPMCAGAVINSRIDTVKFGAFDKKAGSSGSIINLFELEYNHKPLYEGGIMENECQAILKEFFKMLRNDNKKLVMKLIPVSTKEQIINTSNLAYEIWHEFFPSIISVEQIDYMIEMFQSEKAITTQINENGYKYFLMHKNGIYAGYFAIQPHDDGRLFLSKIYVKKEYRGQGFARQTFIFIDEYCKKNNHHAVWLTVNKHNDSSILAYKKLGFSIIGEGVSDIGQGYVMDDYFLERIVKGV